MDLEADVAHHLAALELLAEVMRGEAALAWDQLWPPALGGLRRRVDRLGRSGPQCHGRGYWAADGLAGVEVVGSRLAGAAWVSAPAAAAPGAAALRGTNSARTRCGAAPSVLVRRRGEDARMAAGQIDLEPVAADHVVALGQHDRAVEGQLIAGDVVDAPLALRGLGGRRQEDVALGFDPADRAAADRGRGGALAVAVVVDPELIGAQHHVALDRVDIAGKGREPVRLRDVETIGGNLDRQAAVVLGGLGAKARGRGQDQRCADAQAAARSAGPGPARTSQPGSRLKPAAGGRQRTVRTPRRAAGAAAGSL